MLEVRDVVVELGARRVLASTTLEVHAGESVAVTGPSGSGKTTLLNCICGIVVPTSGSVVLDGETISSLTVAARASVRLHRIGLVLQDPELLAELSVIENAALRLVLAGMPRTAAFDEATTWLCEVGLEHRLHESVDTLSGGEAQRVAVARALAGSPPLVIADEPTASLDEESADLVTRTLLTASRDAGAAVVLATHDPLVAAQCDRRLPLRQPRVA